MKNLLIATDGFVPRWDGIVRFLAEIVPKLASEYDITILAPKFDGEYKPLFDVPVVRFDVLKVPIADLNFALVLKKDVNRYVEEADLVFVQSIGPIGIACIAAAQKKKKPIVAYLHMVDWEVAAKSLKRIRFEALSLVKFIARRYYRKCDLLICPSEEVMVKYEKNHIHTPKTVVSLGADTDHFKPPEDKKLAKESIGLNPEHIIIGYHGRIGREKDLMTLYRAFRRLEKQYPQIRLLIVGKGVKEHVDMFSSHRNIILPGVQYNVVPYLQAMDIYVLPSLVETTCLALLEAMSCGLAVITTPVGYVKEYIIEKENGMIFPFGNSLRLSIKIEHLIKDQALRLSMGQKARQTVVQRFNWDKTYSGIRDALARF